MSGNQEGTYFAVNNGTLYSRNDSTSNVVGEWNLATGMETGTVTFSDMAPAANGTDTFNVNDYTGMNFLQDSTGLYVLGVSANGQDWTLDKVNPMLSVLQSYTFSDPNDPTDPLTIGFAFMAGGELFMGDSYNDPTISYVFNPAADELSDVDITLNGLPSNVYIEGATYVSQTDSLYIVDVLQNTNSILSPYSASGVYVANRVSPALSIPEPSTWALLVTGLAAFLGRSFLRRKGAVRASR
ncbi:MAG: PEP-CTERM sorting domain-containing protein [Verrucomicrobiota bacterium]